MLSVRRTVATSAAPAAVYEYLRDFTHAEQWDPGTESCSRIDGDGGVGTRYRNVSKFLGRTTELTYTAVELQPGTLIHFEGRNDQFVGHDRLRIEPVDEGSQVSYVAEFTFRGVSRIAVPLVALYLPRLADKTVRQLKQCLDALG